MFQWHENAAPKSLEVATQPTKFQTSRRVRTIAQQRCQYNTHALVR
jgi:hypothetical protein